MSKANRERRRGRDRRPTMLVLCAPVGAALPVPAGYDHGACLMCGRAVWSDPKWPPLARRLGLRVERVCNDCCPRDLARLIP